MTNSYNYTIISHARSRTHSHSNTIYIYQQQWKSYQKPRVITIFYEKLDLLIKI